MCANTAKIILAGPGTGKTTTIVSSVISLLESTVSKKDGIVLCTFTRKATEELTQRIYNKLSMADVNRVNFIIGTIHSICYELLSRYSSSDYSDYTILPEGEQIHFIHSKLKNLGYPSSNGWSTAEDLAAIFNKITDQEIDVANIDFSADPELQLACNAYPLYRRILERFRLFDFATIQSTFLNELRIDKSFKTKIKDDFKYFFIDEYQDINPIQHKIFKELSSPEYNITVVGDDDQCIYEFRGSDVSIIRGFKSEFLKYGASIEESILNINYRSTKPIVDFTNNLLSLSDQPNIDKKIVPNRDTFAHKPIIRYFENDSNEVEYITTLVNHLKSNGIVRNFRDIAILYRSVKYHSSKLLSAFRWSGIPYSLYGSGNFFESIIGEEFIALLDFALAKDDSYAEILFDALSAIDEKHGSDLVSCYSLHNYIDKLDKELNTKKYSSCIELAYDIMYICDMFERYKDEGPNLGVLTSLVSSYDEFSSSYDPWNLFSYLVYLKKKQEVDYIDNDGVDGVQVMTIHQSKGLEFPVVIIPSCVERNESKSIIDRFDEFIGEQDKRDDEEFRILYVACTRAEELLVITGSEQLEGAKKKYQKNKYVSKYLSKYSNFCDDIEIDTIARQTSRSKDSSKTDNPTLSYNSVALYRMCPRAYMYSHVWNLATKRIGGMEYGQNVHKIIENILRKVQGGCPIDTINIRAEVENTWKASSIRSLSTDEKFKKAAIEQVDKFIKNSAPFIKPEHVFSSEDQFNITIGGYLVTGRFDAVFKNGDEYSIVDFKTGDKKDYTSQLSFYSLCFKEKYSTDNDINLKVYYLKTGEYCTITPVDGNTEASSIKEIADKIINKQFVATPGRVCSDCAFNHICTFRKKS